MSTQMAPTILVIDDEADIRDAVAQLLDDAGYRVLTAVDGQEALELVSHDLPAVILLDMRMPRMDGWAFARAFRARYDEHAPLVVMTAAADARRWATEVAASAYVGKPFDLDDLLIIVARFAGPGAGLTGGDAPAIPPGGW